MLSGNSENNKNIVAVEVKPISALNDKIEKDVTTLCKFLKFAYYYRAIYLVYGHDGEIEKFLNGRI